MGFSSSMSLLASNLTAGYTCRHRAMHASAASNERQPRICNGCSSAGMPARTYSPGAHMQRATPGSTARSAAAQQPWRAVASHAEPGRRRRKPPHLDASVERQQRVLGLHVVPRLEAAAEHVVGQLLRREKWVGGPGWSGAGAGEWGPRCGQAASTGLSKWRERCPR